MSAARALTWDANSSSNNCSICQKSFGRVVQRKHHCRHCGRLVCTSCSQTRLVLPGLHNEHQHAVNVDSKHNEANKPVRVCDPCKRVILAKQEKQIQQLQHIDKKIELLRATSFISECLLDVYFLDGAFKTICFDESTSVAEVIATLSSASPLRVALFEVEQDLFNPSQFAIVPEEQTIAGVIQRWRSKDWKFAKLVFPIYDSRALKSKTNGSSQIVISRTPSTSTSASSRRMGASVPSKASSLEELTDDQTMSPTATVRGASVDEMLILQREVDRLQGELDRANRKIDTWRAIFGRKAKLPVAAMGASVDDTDSAVGNDVDESDNGNDDSVSVISSSTVATASTVPTNANPQRRESFWNMRFTSSAKSTAKSPEPITQPRAAIPKSSSSNNLALASQNISPVAHTGAGKRSSFSSAPVNEAATELSAEYLETLTDYSLFDQSAHSSYQTEGDLPLTRASLSIASSANNSSKKRTENGVNAFPADSLPSTLFGANDTEKVFLNDGVRFFREDPDRSVLFTRTFFHHVFNLETFLAKYDKFFEIALRTLLSEVDAALDALSSSSTHDEDSDTHKSKTAVALWVSSLYHMAVSWDSVYEQIVDFTETLRPALRAVLPRVFRRLMRLPLADVDGVKCVMHCLLKENMLFGVQENTTATSIVHQALQHCIEEAIMQKIVFDQNTLVYRDYASKNGNGDDSDESGEDADREDAAEERNSLSPLTFFLVKLSTSPSAIRNEMISAMRFSAIEALMQNVIQSFDWVIADLMELFPSENASLAVLPVFQRLSLKVFEEIIKPWFRLAHGLGALKVHDVLIIYQFVCKFAGRLDAYGDFSVYVSSSSSAPSSTGERELRLKMREKWRMQRFELYKLALHSLSGEVEASLSLPACWELFPAQDVFLWLTKRCEDCATMSRMVTEESTSSSALSSLFAFSARPEQRWATDTLRYLSELMLQGVMKCDVDAHSEPTDASSSSSSLPLPANIRFSLMHLLLDNLQQSSSTAHTRFISSQLIDGTNNSLSLILVAFVHSHAKFAASFQSLWDSLSDLLPQYSEQDCRNIEKLAEKWKVTVQMHEELVLRAMGKFVEICEQDMKTMMTEMLFVKKNGHAWDTDVFWINALKKMLKTRFLIISVLLDGKAYPVRSLLNMTAEDMKVRLLLHVCESLVAQYVESLLCNYQSSSLFSIASHNGSYTATAQHTQLLTRVNEDIQLIVAAVEELRGIVTTDRDAEDSTHVVPTAEIAAGKSFSVRAPGLSGKALKFGRLTSKQGKSNADANAMPKKSNNGVSIFSNVENIHTKQMFDELVKPLSHLSILLSMMMTFVPPSQIASFVQRELTQSFGLHSVNIWQLMCGWRGDKKENIAMDFQAHLKDWLVEQQGEMSRKEGEEEDGEPKVNISFISKIKAANIVKF